MTLSDQRKYRVFREDGWNKHPKADLPLLLELRGKYGSVYPYSANELIAYSRSGVQWAKLKRLDFASIHQNGDREGTIRFDWNESNLEQVAKILRLKKRRIMTPEQKAIASERLKNMRHGPGKMQAQSPKTNRT